MKNCFSKFLKCGLIGCLSAAYWVGAASADSNEPAAQEFKNISTTQTGYDLTLYFTKKLAADPTDTTGRKDWPTVQNGAAAAVAADSVSADGLSAHWNSVPGGSVAPGAAALLAQFTGPKAQTDPNDPNKTIPGIALDFVNSSFSMDDAHHHTAIRGSVGSAGQTAGIFFHRDASGQFFAFTRFFNPEEVPVIYNNIEFFVNNHMANYNGPAFEVPTGQLLPGLPHEVVIAPGQSSLSLLLGPVDTCGYVLGLTPSTTTPQPRNSYRVAAAGVPCIPAQPIQLVASNADVIVIQTPTGRFAQPFNANTFAWFER